MANKFFQLIRKGEEFRQVYQILREGLAFDLTGATAIDYFLRVLRNAKDDDVVAGGGFTKSILGATNEDLPRSQAEVFLLFGDLQAPDDIVPGKFFWDFRVVPAVAPPFYFPPTPQPAEVIGGGTT